MTDGNMTSHDVNSASEAAALSCVCLYLVWLHHWCANDDVTDAELHARTAGRRRNSTLL